jgi:hypothetical protein
MTVTRTEARDEILAQFKTVWDAGPESTGVLVRYPDAPNDPPSTQVSWARVTVQHNPTGGQATLSGAQGKRRYRRFGLVTVQIFTIFGQGLVLADRLSETAQVAFEGVSTPGGVIFRSVNAVEIGRSKEWFQTNVVAQFEYDEVK